MAGESYYRALTTPIIKGVEFQASAGGVLLVSIPGPGKLKPDLWEVPVNHVVLARCIDGKVHLTACPEVRATSNVGDGGPYKGD